MQRDAGRHAAGSAIQTDDKEDRFAASFADLEAFQVDYTEKNLRVRVRKGKQYNFTDPTGNADKLFVFHRDVDKARQRLASGASATASEQQAADSSRSRQPAS